MESLESQKLLIEGLKIIKQSLKKILFKEKRKWIKTTTPKSDLRKN